VGGGAARPGGDAGARLDVDAWYIARNEARWNAGEDLLASGVPPTEITSYWEWNSYHGAYDLYVEQRKRVTATQTDYLFQVAP